jgi:hypothetical protein
VPVSIWWFIYIPFVSVPLVNVTFVVTFIVTLNVTFLLGCGGGGRLPFLSLHGSPTFKCCFRQNRVVKAAVGVLDKSAKRATLDLGPCLHVEPHKRA